MKISLLLSGLVTLLGTSSLAAAQADVPSAPSPITTAGAESEAVDEHSPEYSYRIGFGMGRDQSPRTHLALDLSVIGWITPNIGFGGRMAWAGGFGAEDCTTQETENPGEDGGILFGGTPGTTTSERRCERSPDLQAWSFAPELTLRVPLGRPGSALMVTGSVGIGRVTEGDCVQVPFATLFPTNGCSDVVSDRAPVVSSLAAGYSFALGNNFFLPQLRYESFGEGTHAVYFTLGFGGTQWSGVEG